MARRHVRPVEPYEPLPRAPLDPRLPSCLQEVEAETFAKNKGFGSYDDYLMSQYPGVRQEVAPDPGPAKDVGHVETAHLPGVTAVTKR